DPARRGRRDDGGGQGGNLVEEPVDLRGADQQLLQLGVSGGKVEWTLLGVVGHEAAIPGLRSPFAAFRRERHHVGWRHTRNSRWWHRTSLDTEPDTDGRPAPWTAGWGGVS